MRFVVFSDIHLHEWQYGSSVVHGRNSRLEQQVRVLHDIVRYCQTYGISEGVVTGDIFHTSVVSAAVSEAAWRGFSAFRDGGINLTFVPGNHDQSSRTGELDALSWFRSLGNLVGGPTVFSIHDCHAAGIPFTHDRETLAQRLDAIHPDARLLFMHQGVGGVEINSKGFTLNEALVPEMVPPHIAMAFTGHYHSRKLVTSNLVIPGSLTQLNWGDSGEVRGWLDVSFDPESNEIEMEQIESNASMFVKIDAPDDFAPITNNFVRLVTADSTPSFIQDAIEHIMAQGAASVEVKNVAQADKFVSNIQVKTFASLNEVIYSFAQTKERQGEIDEHAVHVGDQLLRGNYQVPSV